MAPGAAVGVAGAVALSEEYSHRLVPAQNSTVPQARIDYLEEIIWKYDAPWAKEELKALKDSGRIVTQVRLNQGFAEGLNRPTGVPHLATGGSLSLGAGVDMFFQYFGDRDACLSPRQQYYRVLTAGGLSIVAGGAALATGAGLLSLGVAAGYSAAASVGVGVGAGVLNDQVVKPTLFPTLGLGN